MPMFGEKASEKIVRATKRGLKDTALTPGVRPRPTGITVFEGELVTDLIATDDGKSNPTTCRAVAWVPTPGDTHDPIRMENGIPEFALVNRSQTLPAAPPGTYCVWIRLRNEWRIIYVDC